MLYGHGIHVRDQMPSLQTKGRKLTEKDTFSVSVLREVKRDNITSRIACLFQ